MLNGTQLYPRFWQIGGGGGDGPPIVGVCRAARWYDVPVEVKYDATRLEVFAALAMVPTY